MTQPPAEEMSSLHPHVTGHSGNDGRMFTRDTHILQTRFS